MVIVVSGGVLEVALVFGFFSFTVVLREKVIVTQKNNSWINLRVDVSVGINVEKHAKYISHVQEKIPPFRDFFNGNLMFCLRLSFTKKVTSPNCI